VFPVRDLATAGARDRDVGTGVRHDPDQLVAGLDLIDAHRGQLRQQRLEFDVTPYPLCLETRHSAVDGSEADQQLRKSWKSRLPYSPGPGGRHCVEVPEKLPFSIIGAVALIVLADRLGFEHRIDNQRDQASTLFIIDWLPSLARSMPSLPSIHQATPAAVPSFPTMAQPLAFRVVSSLT